MRMFGKKGLRSRVLFIFLTKFVVVCVDLFTSLLYIT